MAETHGEYSFDIVKCSKNLGLVPMGLQIHVPAESRNEWYDTDMVIRRIKTLKRRVGEEALREIGTELVPMLFRLFPAVFQDKKIDSPLKALE